MTKRTIHNFRELKIWQRSMSLVKKVYVVTEKLPKSELFGLTLQIRKSAVSMPSNIAEGCGRGTNSQLQHFLDFSHASSCELETQIILTKELNYLPIGEVDLILKEIAEFQKMILSFRNSLE